MSYVYPTSAKGTERDKQKAVLTPLMSRVRKSFPLSTTSSSGKASGVLSISSIQLSEWSTHQHLHSDSSTLSWSETKNIHPQCHSMRLQARAVPHCPSSILTPILKIKLFGMNSDAGLIPLEWITNIFILAYYCMHLVRERLKAATCIQKIKCQISLLQAAPSHCHSEHHIISLTEKSQLFLYLLFKFWVLHPKTGNLKNLP